MAEKNQARPLAPASHRIIVDDDDEALSTELKKSHSQNRKCLKFCGCFTAVFLILAVIMLVLAFTVFRVKEPVLKMNSVTIEGLEFGIGANLRAGTNVTVIADASVKNPNVASFRFNNATTSLFYDGRLIGEAVTPPGHARARQTLHMNVTIVVMVDRIITIPRLGSDLLIGELPVSSYTRISGKVEILKIIKKNVTVKLNCTMIVNLRDQSIRDQRCKNRVSL